MRRFALAAAGILLAFLFAEIVLRLLGIGLVRPELQFDVRTRNTLQAGRYVPDRHLFWREADGPPTDYDRGIRAIRPGDQPPPKQSKFRILCLGDSCTRLAVQGWPYSVILEQALGSARAEVFNASLPGYSSYQGLAWLRQQLLDYAPDLVIVYFGWNDHWRSTGLSDRNYAAMLSPFRSRLISLLRPHPEPPPLRVPVGEFRENLRQIAQLISQRGGHCLLVTAPSHITAEGELYRRQVGTMAPGDDTTLLHGRYVQVVRELAGDPEPRVFDAAALFDAIGEPERLLHQDGIHPTAAGHLVLGWTLAQFIVHTYLGVPGAVGDLTALALGMLAREAASAAQWQDAIQLYRRGVQSDPHESGVRLGLAWLLATCPDAGQRNGDEALALLADSAAVSTSSPFVLDIRAAACAETGRFDQAVQIEQQAVGILLGQVPADSSSAEAMQERLELYKQGQPYRLPAPPEP